VIADEQAMLFENGVLVQGCCHAGIINTLEYCRKCAPEIPVHSIVGGLHLLHADTERLKQTADYLHQYGVEKLYLMHCTGANAIDYMKNAGLTVITPTAGESFSTAE
jgi:7,8-dihydropterin-6-yl-methyl-4-(beta-D-ribofuranosyl)aminobenzene 5'-phosphate synthase